MVAVAHSNNPDGQAAGEAIARAAIGRLAGSAPSIAIVFAGGRLGGDAVLAGVRSVLPDAPVVGGAAVGTMTHEEIGSTGYEASIAVLPAVLGEVQVLVERGLDEGEHEAGRALGARLAEVCNAESVVLLFYDSVKRAPPPELHVASRIVAGINEGLGDLRPVIVGGGTLCDLELRDAWLFDGEAVARHCAVAVVLPRRLKAETSIIHGCEPISSFIEISAIDGAVVRELNGKPAASVLAERLSMTVDDLADPGESMPVTLGAKKGDPFADFDEAAYVNRMIIGVDADAGTVTLFEADFAVGDKVQIMTTSLERMNESAAACTADMLSSLEALAPARSPCFALYIDCAGRSPMFCGADVEEADIVRKGIGAHCPVLGFFSGVEIAPVNGVARPLDWTGVLAVIHGD